MKTISFHIVRVGLGITFLWIGVLILKEPMAWGGYLQPWAAGLLPMPLTQAMIATAILDIVIGFLFLVDFYTWLAALIAGLHIITVFIVSGITDVTVRDIGIFTATLMLLNEGIPQNIRQSLVSQLQKQSPSSFPPQH